MTSLRKTVAKGGTSLQPPPTAGRARPSATPRKTNRLDAGAPANPAQAAPQAMALAGQRSLRLAASLVAWYRLHRRPLPWRQASDPYLIWVSEIMLQQTQVATVVPYFERFRKSFPTLKRLAQAELPEVLEHWQGLGYYSRARNLHAAAQQLTSLGQTALPSEVTELLKLPGIGRYTAGAISSIAYGRPAPIVDGNVTRVLCRVDALADCTSLATTQSELWRRAGELVTLAAPGELNQGLMELGALVCTPMAPDCPSCPWRPDCQAHRQGRVATLPIIPKKQAPERRRSLAWLLTRPGSLLLLQQPLNAQHWAGLQVLPYLELHGAETLEQAEQRLAASLGLPRVAGVTQSWQLAHSITRYRYALTGQQRTLGGNRQPAGASWVPLEELAKAALPAPHRKLVRSWLTALEEGS